MRNAVSSEALDQIFRTARTYNGWSDTPVDEGIVRDLYGLLRWGPTSANSCPARFVWVRSPEGKARLAGLAAEKNRPKILAAPLTVIIGNDLDFPDVLSKLLPHNAEMAQKISRPPRSMRSVTAGCPRGKTTLLGFHRTISAQPMRFAHGLAQE
jgi:3-hydroxypropanoate dehydrogenase